MSPSGRCRFGDVGADGYVRSEGVVALVLKPLDRARADGDRVHAVILGSSAVHDGRTGDTLIAPGVQSQAEMMRSAYAMAGVSPADVDYIEAHGPGTVQGDRAELSALAMALGEDRPADRPVIVGSVKSNIGHTEPTAGLAALVKTILAMKHRTIPKTLHVREQNPVLRDAPLRLALETLAWPDTGRPALAGASAFGLSGTNVHVVLTDAPASPQRTTTASSSAFVLPMSARSGQALRDLAGRYRDTVGPVGDAAELADVCWSAGVRRTHHDHRAAVVGDDVDSLIAGLDSLIEGRASEHLTNGNGAAVQRPRVVFVFPGQGSQWPGMGRELLEREPVFADSMRECDAAIKEELGWSLIDRLQAKEQLVDADVVQPALWAMQTSLAAVWRAWGIEPDLLIGHSQGEISAATVSGALSVAAAAAVVCRRSTLLRSISGKGGMAVVQLNEREAEEAIADFDGELSVGVVNSDRSCVLSGDRDALAKALAPLRERGVYCQIVQVDYASHSGHVDEIAEQLKGALADLRPCAGTIPIHSTLGNSVLTGQELDAAYWTQNLREPVRFGAAIDAVLAGSEPVLFVEVSPHPVLAMPIADGIEAAGGGSVIGSIRRDEPELRTLLAALAESYVAGCEPRWEVLQRDARYVPLPLYPWQRGRHWVDERPLPAADAGLEPRVPEHRVAAHAPTTGGVAAATQEPVTITLRMAPGASANVEVAGFGSAQPASPRTTANGAAPRSEAPLVAPRAGAIRSREELKAYLLERAIELLQVDPADLEVSTSLTKAGLDSLLAMKLRRAIVRDIGLDLAPREFLQDRTIEDVAALLGEDRGLVRSS
jgi:acyl transferase domain-containing protein